jgi:hypothetical protein
MEDRIVRKNVYLTKSLKRTTFQQSLNTLDNIFIPRRLSQNRFLLELFKNKCYDIKGAPLSGAKICKEGKKAAHREKQFPIDLENAYQLGKRLIQKVVENNGND